VLAQSAEMVRRGFDIDARLEALVQGTAPAAPVDMRIADDGSWFHDGGRIPRPALVKLFASALHRAYDGSYWLVTPVEAVRVVVEDVPFTVVELEQVASGQDQRLRLRSNLDEWIEVDSQHPLEMREVADGRPPVPYVTLRPATGRRLALEARLLRPVFYHLVELAQPMADGRVGIRSAGSWFPLGSAAPA
jgi:hypothetical protein